MCGILSLVYRKPTPWEVDVSEAKWVEGVWPDITLDESMNLEIYL